MGGSLVEGWFDIRITLSFFRDFSKSWSLGCIITSSILKTKLSRFRKEASRNHKNGMLCLGGINDSVDMSINYKKDKIKQEKFAKNRIKYGFN
jgi:hypothetical protein